MWDPARANQSCQRLAVSRLTRDGENASSGYSFPKVKAYRVSKQESAKPPEALRQVSGHAADVNRRHSH